MENLLVLIFDKPLVFRVVPNLNKKISLIYFRDFTVCWEKSPNSTDKTKTFGVATVLLQISVNST